MRRWVALAAAVLIASVPVTAVPAAAQTTPPDPVGALKRQFRPENGVQIAEIMRSTVNDKVWARIRANGRLQFGPSGLVASDGTWQTVPAPRAQEHEGDGSSSEESLRIDFTIVGKNAYVSGLSEVPRDKSWVRLETTKKRGYSPARFSTQTLKVFDPAVLKVVLKESKGRPVSGGFLYRGTMSYAELYRAAKNVYASEFRGLSPSELREHKVTWRLWTDGTGLPTRLMTTDVWNGKSLLMVDQVDTRYTDWGSHVLVVAPPADQVIDEKDLRAELPDLSDPKELINTPAAP
ncbi:hypothetical protein [Streptosporangium sp. NPDC051022]|uniref:hypothetical protein n=1 Tax=Streptosporangium sp. NPDC051022 TaxID=3155752 RepID=UPI0034168818